MADLVPMLKGKLDFLRPVQTAVAASDGSIPNTFRFGAVGTGKSTASRNDNFEIAMRKDRPMAFFEPHGEGEALRDRLVAAGHGDRVIYECIEDVERVVGYDFIPRPTGENWLRRRQEAELHAREFLETAAWRRGIFQLSEHPWIELWGMLAVLLWMWQRVLVPVILIPFYLTPDSEPFQKGIENCRQGDVASMIARIKNFSLHMREAQVEPARRILTNALHSTSMLARSIPSIDLVSA